MITIKKVETKKDLKDFVMYPFELYKKDPNWVAPLLTDEFKVFDRHHNPFFSHSDVDLFLAFKNNTVCGRIAAIVNRNHNEFQKEKVVFFGYYDIDNDIEISRELMKKVIAFGKERGMTILRGPMNFSTNETCGMLFEGYNSAPVIMMTYNAPYYNDHMQALGLTKAKDLLSYEVDATKGLPEKLDRIGKLLIKRNTHIEIRHIEKKNINVMIEDIRTVYNGAWESNWGFVPLTSEEFDHMAESMKSIIEPSIAFVAYKDNKPVGFSLTLMDANQATKHAKGRLFPFGLLKILHYWKKIDCARNITMGVISDFRKQGIEAMMIWYTFTNSIKLGVKRGDLGWILEDNEMMNRELLNISAYVYKRYRVYEQAI